MGDKNLEGFFGLNTQPDNLDNLLKLEHTRSLMKKLCVCLAERPAEFDIDLTTNIIVSFIGDKEKNLERLLYSELANQIFDLGEQKKANVFTNLDVLIEKFSSAVNEKTEDEDIRHIEKIIIKIYDHIHLVENQMTMVKRSMEEAEKKSKEEIKAFQKEYIAILSIFSAVVLTFSGGLTFSSSVLENIDDVSMYRIVFIALLIGFVLLNLFYALFHYIREILEIKTNYKTMMCMNLLFTVFMVLTFIAWCCGCIEHRDEQIISQYKLESTENVELNFNYSK